MSVQVGSVIARKDMPELKYKITGENEEWNAWNVRPLFQSFFKSDDKKCGMVMKNDERWIEVEHEDVEEEK